MSDPDTFRSAGHAVVDGVADHLAELPTQPVWQPLPDDLRERLLALPLPARGIALDDLVETMLRDVLPHAMGNGHPAFFGWVNPPPSAAGVLASLPAAAMNPSVVGGDHADVHLERAAVRWLAELVGFPHSPGGGRRDGADALAPRCGVCLPSLLGKGRVAMANPNARPNPPAGARPRESGRDPALRVRSA